MPGIRIGTFNCENLFARYRFLDQAWENKHYVNLLRPAADLDSIVSLAPGREDRLQPEEISRKQRKNTAQVILHNKPDIVAVQEVESLPTLRLFNTHFLDHHFNYSLLIDGNDQLRLIDVGLLSRNGTLLQARTHMFDEVTFPDRQSPSHVFSRDCLEVDVVVGNSLVTFLVNHFKAQTQFTRRRKKPSDIPTHDVWQREEQARRVAEIVDEKYSKDKNSLYIVLGDLNCAPAHPDLKALYKTNALIPVERSVNGEEWTHFLSAKGGDGRVSKLDYIFLSPALAKANKNARLLIERGGLDPACKQYKGPRFDGVDGIDTEASDHCGVFLDIEV